MKISHAETVTRDTQRTDVVYVVAEDDDAPFYTPDGVGRIWLFADEDQTIPMTPRAAAEEIGADEICYLDTDPDD